MSSTHRLAGRMSWTRLNAGRSLTRPRSPMTSRRHSGAMTDRDLLAAAIKRSGLSARAFARDVLWRDERTIRRWLSGESPVPDVVADRLRDELRDTGD